MPRFLSLAIALTMCAAAAPSAQDRSQPFRAEAELVTIDAVVVDRDGQPIADLTNADFVVKEDGRPQTVKFFQSVTADRQSPAASRTHTRRYPYSSNVGVEARAGRSFVLFFDDIHLTQEQGERAKEAVERFLTDEARDGDLVSLVAPARALRWHARLPEGRAELLVALRSLRGRRLPDAALERISDYEAYRIHVLNDEQMAERVGRRFSNYRVAGRDPVDLQRDQGPRPEQKGGTAGLIEPLVLARATEAYGRAAARNRATLGALAQTIQAMAAVRGRKSIVVLSPGFIMDQELAVFRQVEDAARRANTTLYFLDIRGLQVQSGFASAEFGSPIDSRDIGAANADMTLEAEGAVALAETSGGFSVQNRNDLGAGLQRIGRESRVYYLLGYSPPDRRDDGKFRRVTVEVSRPGAQVRARKGYYAGGVSPDMARRSDEENLEVALDSPYDVAALPIRTAAFVFGKTNASDLSVLVAVEADLRAFDLKPGDGTLNDVLDLRILVTDPSTGETTRHERAVEMNLRRAVPRDETSAWYPLSQPFELPAGRYQARVAIRDRNSGRVGSVTHDFEVPDRHGLSVSSVLLTDTIETAALGSPAAPRPVLIVRRLLTAGTTLYYQFSVFEAARTAGGGTRVRAGHVVRRGDGSIVKQLEPTLLTPGPNGMSRFAGISLAGLPAGDYELVLTVTDDVRSETVTVHEAFAIAEPARP